MSTRAEITFHVQSWDERTLSEVPSGPRLTRAKVTKRFEGDFEGESTMEYVMLHQQDGNARFNGLEQLTGQFDGKKGSFVLSHEGVFEDGVAQTTCRVMDNSGTGDLESITGEGSFEAEGRTAQMVLIYELD